MRTMRGLREEFAFTTSKNQSKYVHSIGEMGPLIRADHVINFTQDQSSNRNMLVYTRVSSVLRHTTVSEQERLTLRLSVCFN